MTWCPRPFVLLCSSIRRMLHPPSPSYGPCRKPHPPSALQIQILNATTIGEIDAAFATLERERPDALFVAGDAFFQSRAVQFVHVFLDPIVFPALKWAWVAARREHCVIHNTAARSSSLPGRHQHGGCPWSHAGGVDPRSAGDPHHRRDGSQGRAGTRTV